MALQRETVWFSQQILCPTHVVITNVRPDHAESMGEGFAGVASTLALAAAPGRPLYIGEESGAEILRKLASQSGEAAADVRLVPSRHFLDQARDLAQRVAEDISPCNKQAGLRHKEEKPLATSGRLEIATITFEENPPLLFVDLFSANDVVSVQKLNAELGLDGPDAFNIVLLATRADRPLRTKSFLTWLAEQKFDLVIAMGSHAPFALLYGSRLQLPIHPMWPFMAPPKVLERLCRIARERPDRPTRLIGLGNAHGFGEQWRSFCHQAGEAKC